MIESIHTRRVAVFRRDLLALSETFIRAQIMGLERWQAVLVGEQRIPDGLSLDDIDVRLVPPAASTFIEWADRLRFWLNRPIPRLIHAFKSLDPDLVHAHFATDATNIWPSVKAAGLPMLVTLHGYDINIYREWWEAGHGGLRKRVYPRRLLKMARDPSVRFVAVSKEIERRAIEYGIPPEKLFVRYIGVDAERFKPGGLPLTHRNKRILFVGRMVPNKAPLLMVRAFAESRKVVPDAELTMIGDGPLLESAKRLADELNVPIAFLGARSSEEVLAQLHEARALCLPSITIANGASEAFGLVLLEAQSCGVPVITSARAACTEGMLDGKTGYTFNEGNIMQCADKICMVLGHPENASAMSVAASAFVEEHFEINRLTAKLEELYTISLKRAL